MADAVGAGARRYEVVAMRVPISYNKHGDHDHDGLVFALRRHHQELSVLRESFDPRVPHPLVRPLVLRACAGEMLEVALWNHIEDRLVGLHLVGGGYDVRTDDGAHVGANPDTRVPFTEHTDGEPQRVYRWRCGTEGVFVFHDGGNFDGDETGTNAHGLFGVLVVEPPGSTWRDPTGAEASTSLEAEVDGLYVDVLPGTAAGSAAATAAPWLGEPVKYPAAGAAFREFVVVIHDEPRVVNHTPLAQVAPPWGGAEHAAGLGGHPAEGVSHVMPISYRAEPMANREHVLWSRLTGTPVEPGGPVPDPLEVPVVNEEQHHSSWLFGDPSTPILRAYLGDPVRIRLVHAGVKETHVFHLHVYEWHADPANRASPLIDAITIGPQTGHTIEPLWGAGNRQGVAGDVIWHCHLYPHFHHGMWGLFRTYDRLRDGTDTEVQHYPDGTQIPRLLPLPVREPPPPPAHDLDGWPRYMIETRTGAGLPPDPLDRAGRVGQKSPRVPWLEGPVPDGFDYRAATDGERSYFFQHRDAGRDGRFNIAPEPGWLAPSFAFAPQAPRVSRDLEVLRQPFRYNDHGWVDPRGHRYRMADLAVDDALDDTLLREGAKTVAQVPVHGGEPEAEVVDPQPVQEPQYQEPLFFRVHDGDGVELTLHNRIAYPIPGDAYDHALPRPGVPGLWECGLHVHLVKFDVVTADGAASGWNYMSAPRPGYRMHYKWWADEEFGVIFTHDHLFANYRQKRGLFAAMLVEPAGSRWVDPHSGEELVAGEQAVVLDAPGGAFRELGLAVGDFVPLHGPAGELNPPEEPTSDGDQGAMGVNYRSAPLRERHGDPSAWFSSQVHGDPATPILETYPGEQVRLRLLQGAHEEQHAFSANGLRWRRFRGDGESPLRSQQTLGLSEAFTFDLGTDSATGYGAGDHLWRFAGVDDTWLGCWGLVRAHSSETECLPRLPGSSPLTVPEPPADAPVRRFSVVAEPRRLDYGSGRVDRYGLVYRVVSMTGPGGRRTRFPEPLPGSRIEPLVLRCRAGEVVEVKLTNHLPAAMTPEPFEPQVPVEGEEPRPVSRRVSLHADLVHVDVRTHDGSRVGQNPDSTVAPGATRTYRWWAPDELGPVPLTDLADVRHHRHHGLLGALVVEPPGSEPRARAERMDERVWTTRLQRCWQAAASRLEVVRRGRATESGTPRPVGHPRGRPAWTGLYAHVHTDQGEVFEEIVAVMQDGLRLFRDDDLTDPVPDAPPDMGEEHPDPEDQGNKAINYRSAPAEASGWLAGWPTEASTWSVPCGSQVRLHLVGGFDKPRNHCLTVHGHDWPEYPHRGEASARIGAESGLSVGTVRTLHLVAANEGDHAVRSGVLLNAVCEGLWAVLRVHR
ncbi:MAG: hypothetical protein GEU93_16740 [Propionibacteriales bacterium]|nr:hypothetical protein [Propionibacteriales bacterium]